MRLKVLSDEGQRILLAKEDPNTRFNYGDVLEVKKNIDQAIESKRKYFWALVDWVINNDLTRFFPEHRKSFFTTDRKLNKVKLYYILRWDTGLTKVGYDKDGMEAEEVMSTADDNLSSDDWDMFINEVRVLLGSYNLDLSNFDNHDTEGRNGYRRQT